MNREKQVEEMTKIIYPYCKAPCPNGGCIGCFDYRLSEAIYNAGYYKASEVAREIVKLIEAVREEFSPTEYHRGYNDALDDFKKAIEKRYTEEVNYG